MKPLLIVLLAVSVAANLVLGLRAARSAATAPAQAAGIPAAPPPAAVTGSTAADSAPRAPANVEKSAGPVPHLWRAVASEQDLHRMVADLRAAGYPAPVIRSIVQHLLSERFRSRQNNANKPFWKSTPQTPEAVTERLALNRERQALFESLLGADARPSAMMDEEARQRRYGTLGDDKIDAIARIERDYGEMSSEMWARRRGNTATNAESLMQSQQLMEQERMADIAAALTPEEFAQYEMRNSSSASNLINKLRQVEVTEQEYAALFAAQKAYDQANPQVRSLTAATAAQRQVAQLALHEQARALLGEERFYAYMEGADRGYATAKEAFKDFPAVTPTTTYAVYQLQVELQAAMTQLGAGGGTPTQDRGAQMRTTVEAYNAQLEQLVGSAAAAAYRKQGMGRMFGSFSTVPRTQPIPDR